MSPGTSEGPRCPVVGFHGYASHLHGGMNDQADMTRYKLCQSIYPIMDLQLAAALQ